MAALKLYRKFLPSRQRLWWETNLRRLRNGAGESRNCDVFIRYLESHSGREELESLLSVVRSYRASAHSALRKTTAEISPRRLKRQAKRLRRGLRRKSKRRSDPPLHHWADARLQRVIARFLEAAPDAQSDSVALHRFRIKGKQLRYTLELVSVILLKSEHQEMVQQVGQLQDRLGKLNDLITLARLTERLFPLDRAPTLPSEDESSRDNESREESMGENAQEVSDHARKLQRELMENWEAERKSFLLWWNEQGTSLCRRLTKSNL
jgi:CHAD domain-containing protein